MASDEELKKELLNSFNGEFEEYLTSLNRNLIELERGSVDVQIINEIFRIAHNLKGVAGIIGLHKIQAMAHSLENLFSALCNNSFTSDAFDLVYEGIDQIHKLMVVELDGEQLPTEIHQEFEKKIEQLLANVNLESPSLPQQITAFDHKLGDVDKSVTNEITPTKHRADNMPRTAGNGAEKREWIRIPVTKVDRLMSDMGKMLIARNRYEQRIDEMIRLQVEMVQTQKEWAWLRPLRCRLIKIPGLRDLNQLLIGLEQHQLRLKSLNNQIEHLTKRSTNEELHFNMGIEAIQSEVQNLRMVPIRSLYEPLRRQVRDLAGKHDKMILLELAGEETELDRQLIEAIRDPLIHLIRNSIDHGLEVADIRIKNGKDAQGRLKLNAYQTGNQFVLEFSDDGKGIDLEKVKEKAITLSLIDEDEIGSISRNELLELIFRPGFSTATNITETSGRGVGLDVVKVAIEKLRGQLIVDSEIGGGTKFRITLPLTLATMHTLFARVSNEIYAFPANAVEQAIRIRRQESYTIESRRAILFQGKSLSLFSLCDILDIDRDDQEDTKEWLVLVLMDGRERAAFIVDEILAEQEVVVQSLGKQLKKVKNISGGLIRGDGSVVLLLNPAELLQTSCGDSTSQARASLTKDQDRKKRRKILVIDDSITTRTLEKNILEIAGYEVLLAKDGAEGLALASTSGCELVISDIEMPKLNGFELTMQIKGDEKLKQIPVILVSSLGSQQDQVRGVQSGADAY